MGNHLLSLANALERRGHQVEMLWAADISGDAPATRWSRISFPRQLCREILRRNEIAAYDAVNLHEPAGMTYARLRARNAKPLPPLVVTSHGVEQRAWEMQPRWDAPSLKSRIVYPLTQLSQSNYALRHADAVACLSSEDAEYLRRKMGVAAGKIHRMNNGVDAVLLNLPRVKSAEPRLLFVGSWLRRKGTREIAAAFAELRRKYSGLKLLVAGCGAPEQQVLADFAAADRPFVEVQPRIAREMLPALLQQDQIFILPSHFEGMPLSLLEAMAAGLPCVTTSTCGMRDVIRDGENGLLAPAGDAAQLAEKIGSLLRSADQRQALGAAARRTAATMTWDRVAEDWERMFLGVAPEKKPLALAYDQWHAQVAAKDQLEGDLENPWHTFARKHTGELRGRTVLEAACGRGQFSAWLERQGARVVGLDFSSEALRLAAGRLNGSSGLVCGDAQQIPCAGESFDVVVSCETLEHVPDPRACLRELRRVLRPGGRLVLTTENYLNVWGLYRLYKSGGQRAYNSGDVAQPIENWMFAPQTANWIRDAGFRILKCDGEQHHLYLLPRTNPSETEARFLSRGVLRGLLKYFGRRFYVVAERGA